MLARYGRYETLRRIASGGMATVYLGRVSGEGGFERLVALKVMHPHIASDPDFVSMFLDEARLAAQIRHPNVVATIDIQKTDEAMFLVMDFVDGPTLQDLRKHLKERGERIPVETTLRIFIDVLSGLQEAHDLRDKNDQPQHLVHRDVSPHNVLIGKDGVARLTDFGVARAEARISTTRGGQLKGKIAYMPPEQIMGKTVDRTADIYSAGACLWEALTGRRLWRAANEGALVHAILDGSPTPPSEVADVPAAVEAVVLKALAADHRERYAEALDMADALEAAAREAGLKVPRNRDVGRFIRRVSETLKMDPEAKREGHTPAGKERRPVDSHVGFDGSDATSEPSLPSAVASNPSMAVSSPAAQLTPTGAAPSGPGQGSLSSSGSHLLAPQGVPGQAGISSPSHPIPGQVLNHPAAMQGIDMDHSQPSVVTSPTQSTTTYSLQPKPSRSGAIAVGVAGGIGLVALLFVAFSGRSDASSDTAFHAYSYAAKTADEKAEAVLTAQAEAAAGGDEDPGEDPPDPPAPEPKQLQPTKKKRPIRYPAQPPSPKPPSEPSPFKPPGL